MADQTQKSRRVLVIGWDGATMDLAGPWMDAGYLPTLARLREQGAAGRLRSVLPIMSPAAWTSFATGVNAGQHGIFDFAQRDPASYRLRLISSRDIKAPTLWRLLSDAGKRVVVVNVPLTYPAESVNGVMVTGLGTPDRQTFTHPAELSGALRAKGYRVNKSVFYRPGGEAAFLKDTYDLTQRVADEAIDLLTQRPWDFGMVVFRDTDEMAHFFWKHMDAKHPAHNPVTDMPFHDALRDYYRYLDGLTARLIEVAGPDTDIILMSDHGMGPLYKDVYLNEWLRQQGLLATQIDLSRPGGGQLGRLGITRSNISRLLQRSGLAKFERWLRTTLGDKAHVLPANDRATFPDAIDWLHTQAYSFGYHGQIYVNLKGREPAGVVEPGQAYQDSRAHIEKLLRSLVDPDDGVPVVSDVIPQEKAFTGPYSGLGADLVIIMRDLAYITRHGYEFSGKSGSIFTRPATFESGSHRLYGLVFFAGIGFGALDNIKERSILDLAPTILELLGVSVPQHMEGTSVLHPTSPGEHYVDLEHTARADAYERVSTADQGSVDSLSQEDEDELSERLRNLGYLG